MNQAGRACASLRLGFARAVRSGVEQRRESGRDGIHGPRGRAERSPSRHLAYSCCRAPRRSLDSFLVGCGVCLIKESFKPDLDLSNTHYYSSSVLLSGALTVLTSMTSVSLHSTL